MTDKKDVDIKDVDKNANDTPGEIELALQDPDTGLSKSVMSHLIERNVAIDDASSSIKNWISRTKQDLSEFVNCATMDEQAQMIADKIINDMRFNETPRPR